VEVSVVRKRNMVSALQKNLQQKIFVETKIYMNCGVASDGFSLDIILYIVNIF
jgi:hypothetical protein